MRKLKVLVLCGGKSAERLVSVVSAKMVLESLDRSRYEPELVFIDAAGRWRRADPKSLTGKVEKDDKGLKLSSRSLSASDHLSNGDRPDVVFPVLHGPMGEDGTMQGLLELSGVPYVGCGVLGSAVGMDKEFTKRLAENARLPVLPWACVHDPEEAPAAARKLGYPVFVKPARMGSSVGVSKARNSRQLAKAVKTALRFDDKAILEKGIAAREIEVAVLGDPWAKRGDRDRLTCSIIGEIMPNADFYDYKTKYLAPERAKLQIPAPLSEAQNEEVRRLATRAFWALDLFGMARVDFLMDKRSGKLWFNEANTIPGFTAASMYPMLFRESGIPTPELVGRLIGLALRRQKARGRLKTAP